MIWLLAHRAGVKSARSGTQRRSGLSQRMRAYATVSPTPPEIERLPLAGVHLSGFAAVVSVHMTILSAPVKQASLTSAVPSLSVVLPLQGAPEVIEKPPNGPHELIVVGGTGGCDATWRHPAAVNPATAANPRSANLLTSANFFASTTMAPFPRIRPPPKPAS
jgi:hypothetical protein